MYQLTKSYISKREITTHDMVGNDCLFWIFYLMMKKVIPSDKSPIEARREKMNLIPLFKANGLWTSKIERELAYDSVLTEDTFVLCCKLINKNVLMGDKKWLDSPIDEVIVIKKVDVNRYVYGIMKKQHL